MSNKQNHQIYLLIAKNLKNIREEKKLTQEELAKLVDLNRTSITNIENCKQCEISQLNNLANPLNNNNLLKQHLSSGYYSEIFNSQDLIYVRESFLSEHKLRVTRNDLSGYVCRCFPLYADIPILSLISLIEYVKNIRSSLSSINSARTYNNLTDSDQQILVYFNWENLLDCEFINYQIPGFNRIVDTESMLMKKANFPSRCLVNKVEHMFSINTAWFSNNDNCIKILGDIYSKFNINLVPDELLALNKETFLMHDYQLKLQKRLSAF